MMENTNGPGMEAAMGQPRITPDMVRNARTMTCSCGGRVFNQGIVMKNISAIMSPDGREMGVPVQVLYCKDCGLIHPETDPDNVIPEDLKSKKVTLNIK